MRPAGVGVSTESCPSRTRCAHHPAPAPPFDTRERELIMKIPSLSMTSRVALTDLVACALMPDAPALVWETAQRVADAILADHAVVDLPDPTVDDEDGAVWLAGDGHEIAVAEGLDVWVRGEPLSEAEVVEMAAGLLAANRLADRARAEVPRL